MGCCLPFDKYLLDKWISDELIILSRKSILCIGCMVMSEIEVEVMNWKRTRKAGQGPAWRGQAWGAGKNIELTSVTLADLKFSHR